MKHIIYTLTTALLLFSCEKKVVFDYEKPKEALVVNAQIHPDSTFKIFLSKTISPTDTINFESKENIQIEVYKNNNFLGFADEYTQPEEEYELGFYSNDEFEFTENDSIKIETGNPNYNAVSAETRIPERPTISRISANNIILDENTMMWGYSLDCNISLSIEDNPLEENYYAIDFFYNANFTFSDFFTGNFTDTPYESKIMFEINDSDAIPSYQRNTGYLISDELFNGESKEINVFIDTGIDIHNKDFEEFYIVVKSLSKEYFLYQKTLSEYYLNSNNPFTNQQEVYNNINNGYGIFCGYNSTIDTVRIN